MAADAENAPALQWIGRSGDPAPASTPVAGFERIAASGDGARVAAAVADGDRSDVWTWDLESGGLTRVTFDGRSLAPVWGPEDRVLFYSSALRGVFNLYAKPLDGGAPARAGASSSRPQIPTSVSRDGRLLAFTEISPDTHADIWVLPLGGGGPAHPIARSPFDEDGAVFSPDGRWLAYESDESNRKEIYVQAYPGPGPRHLVSGSGGTAPFWSADGRTVYYSTGGALFAVTMSDEAARPGKPERVLDGEDGVWRGGKLNGERFLLERTRRYRPRAGEVQVALEWFRDLRRRVPAALVPPPK